MSGGAPFAARVARGVASLLQLASFFLIVAPGLAAPVFRHFGLDEPPPDVWTRVLGVALFVVATVVRIALGGKRPPRRARMWADLAQATNGEFTIEKQDLDPLGWTGGPTVRWNVEGVSVILGQVRGNDRAASTRVSAPFQSEKPLCFNVLPSNFLTRALTSQKFVAVIQAGVRNAAKDAPEAARAQAIRQIGILSGGDVSLGDPRLDGHILVKSNDADLARYVLTGGGVTERMVALRQITKGWTLQLSSGVTQGHSELMLDLQAGGISVEGLRAAKELVEAVVGSLKHNGVIAGSAFAEPRSRAAR